MIQVRVSGGQALKRALLNLTGEGRNAAVREVRRSSLNVQRAAKERAPVDTGRLRNSIAVEYERDGLTGVIGTNVEYAPFQEYGTSRAPARPFLFPAHEEEWPHFIARLRAALGPENVRGGR